MERVNQRWWKQWASHWQRTTFQGLTKCFSYICGCRSVIPSNPISVIASLSCPCSAALFGASSRCLLPASLSIFFFFFCTMQTDDPCRDFLSSGDNDPVTPGSCFSGAWRELGWLIEIELEWNRISLEGPLASQHNVSERMKTESLWRTLPAQGQLANLHSLGQIYCIWSTLGLKHLKTGIFPAFL